MVIHLHALQKRVKGMDEQFRPHKISDVFSHLERRYCKQESARHNILKVKVFNLE